MGKRHCEKLWCFKPCHAQVRIWTASGPGRTVHLCERHHAELLAEAARDKIPVIDKREIERG